MGLYSHISTESLIKTLRQRLSDKEIVQEILDDPETEVEDILKQVVSQIAKDKEFGFEDVVDALLETEEVKKDIPKLTAHMIDSLYDTVWQKFYNSTEGKWKFERDYLPELYDVINVLNSHYIGSDPVLESYDNDALLEQLKGSQELDDWTEEDKRESYNEGYNDAKEEDEEDLNYQRWAIEKLKVIDLNPDEFWIWICNQIGCGYFDTEAINSFIDEVLIPKIEKSTYYQLIAREEEEESRQDKEESENE